MAKRNRPRRGSLGYKPRKRAKKQTPRIRSWASSAEVKPLGFAGYKAGMTHVLAADKRKNTTTSGLEIYMPVTVIDAPPMKVAAIRAYRNGYAGAEVYCDVYANNIKELSRRLTLPKQADIEKKLKQIEDELDNLSDIRLILCTQPDKTSIEKKKPDLMEIALGGENIKEKFDYAKKVLGKEITAEEVLTKNKFVDVSAVSKGKGFEGIVARIGTRIQPRKTEKGRRHGGTGGPWTPARKLWLWPLPGQYGYHTRTEYNKIILDIGKDGKNITPKGGFLHYGNIKGTYIIIHGSVPGPVKRLIRLTPARRPGADESYEVTHIDLSSKQGV